MRRVALSLTIAIPLILSLSAPASAQTTATVPQQPQTAGTQGTVNVPQQPQPAPTTGDRGIGEHVSDHATDGHPQDMGQHFGHCVSELARALGECEHEEGL